MLYGIYAPCGTHEWTPDYEYYTPQVRKPGQALRDLDLSGLQ